MDSRALAPMPKVDSAKRLEFERRDKAAFRKGLTNILKLFVHRKKKKTKTSPETYRRDQISPLPRFFY